MRIFAKRWGFFHHGAHGSCIRRHGKRLVKGNRSDKSIAELPLRPASDLSTFRHDLGIAVFIFDPLPLAKSSNRSRWVLRIVAGPWCQHFSISHSHIPTSHTLPNTQRGRFELFRQDKATSMKRQRVARVEKVLKATACRRGSIVVE